MPARVDQRVAPKTTRGCQLFAELSIMAHRDRCVGPGKNGRVCQYGTNSRKQGTRATHKLFCLQIFAPSHRARPRWSCTAVKGGALIKTLRAQSRTKARGLD